MLLLATMNHKKNERGILFAPMKNVCIPVDEPAASRLNSDEERDGDLTEWNLNTRDFSLLFSSAWEYLSTTMKISELKIGKSCSI